MQRKINRNLWTGLKCIMFLIFTCNVLWYFFEPNLNWYFESVAWPANPVYRVYNKRRFVYPLHLLPQMDYDRLIDINNSLRIINYIDQEPLLLIILVHSAVNNFKKRKVIRDTWGRKREEVKVLFVLGSVDSNTTQYRVKIENVTFGDLIQGSFIDCYLNMTYKHVMGMQYVIYHVPQAKYILKTDDDVFVNVPTMIKFLTVDLSPYGAENMLICDVYKNKPVMRSYRSKWRVSFHDYPLRFYPPYCAGWSVLYSPDVVFKLYSAAQFAKEYFWIDDVYITGILAVKTGVTHTDIEPLVISKESYDDIMKNSLYISPPFVFGRPELNEEIIRDMWHYVVTHRKPGSVLKYLKVH